MTTKSDDRLNPAANFVAGAIGGVFDNLVRQPFDTIKVRIQSMALVGVGQHAQFRNSFDCFYKTLKCEGVRGLYRGITVVMLTDAPVSALYFFGASIGRRLQRDDQLESSIREYFIAGCFGGALTAALVTPFERVKVLLQVEQTKHLGPIHVGKRLWESGGIRSFYRGTTATLCRDIPGGGVYLATYELVKRHLLTFNTFGAKKKPNDFHVMPTVIAGGAAGLANCLVEIPPDVIKSRLQTAPDGTYPQGMRSVFREMIRKGNLLSFYRGFTPIALYSFPGSAAYARDLMSDYRNPAASLTGGLVGGFFDVLVHHPFDTIKVRMQSTDYGERAQFRNSFDCLYKTVKGEGFRGLYRGLTIVVFTDAPLSAVYFFGASMGRRLWRDKDDRSPITLKEHFAAGCLGGLATSIVVTPAERVKVLLQVEQTRHLGPIHIGKQLWQSGGLRSFYRGVWATLLRDVPSGGVYLAIYEWAQRYFISLRTKKHPGTENELNLLATVGAGGTAGMVTCAFALPPDVIKSRLQTAPEGMYPNGMRDVIRELLTKGGFWSFYRGFTPVAMYAFPGSAACMLGYEMTIHFWRRFSTPS